MAPVTMAEEAALIQKINDTLTKIENKATEIIDNINKFLGHWYIPGFLKDGVRKAGEWLVAQLKKMWDALAGAAASSATIVGLPAAPFIAAAGVLVFLGAFFVAGENLRGACSDANSVLTQKLNEDSAFKGGQWPKATADALTDGSLSDGDDTDWHIK